MDQLKKKFEEETAACPDYTTSKVLCRGEKKMFMPLEDRIII